MSERMTPIPFKKLLTIVLEEYAKDGTIFGIRDLYKASSRSLPLFGGNIETPFGPAAGPHTQLSQNLIAGYAAGARFFELKTVQKMDGDDLAACISRPCIYSKDEGYNCEWSTELYVPQAFTEYVNAYVIIKILAKKLGLGDPDGFAFNMSVGYDLAGIKTEKINTFIDGMIDASASPAFTEALKEAAEVLPDMAEYIAAIDPHICRSATISTLHGCPPQEIESIASYLITEKKIHTLVKCNPTILGYDLARKRLDAAGFDYVQFDDHHFREDLQYTDAVPMFHRLIALAKENGVEFGVKLSNTCPVDVKANELPSEEMYMSGKSLYVLTIEMAAKLSAEFGGKLRISYSGGADIWHLSKLFKAGIWPVTMATTLLKPGGYGRFRQLAKNVEKSAYKPFTGVNAEAIRALSDAALSDPHIAKPAKTIAAQRISGKSPLTDCFAAPCRSACPIHQDVPEYLHLMEQSEFANAYKLIVERNALPFITGTICAHKCMGSCTRIHYDKAVDIRKAKLAAARKGFGSFMANPPKPKTSLGIKVAVIGGGPAGLAAAYYLGREGASVTVYEKEKELGGLIRNCLPAFRIPGTAIDRDIRLVQTSGASFVLGQPAPAAEVLLKDYDYVVLATGAQKSVLLNIGGTEYNAVNFLKACKAKKVPALGENVIVIGGGNTAMDAARAALRCKGVKSVSIVYRRTKKYMPADLEEMELAVKEGVQFKELLAPVEVKDGKLFCNVMKLGMPDASGRRSPEPTGESVAVPCDSVISALGEKADPAIFNEYGVTLGEKGKPALANDKIFVIGDLRRGPSTVVEVMADAMAACEKIIGKAHAYSIPSAAKPDMQSVCERKAVVTEEGTPEGRCLGCDSICGNCVSACPNRANVLIKVPGLDMPQVLHLDRACNECGNCAFFCPYDSRPYKDKFTLFDSREDFKNSTNSGFTVLDKDKLLVLIRLEGNEFEADLTKSNPLSKELELFILAVIKDYAWML